MWVFMNTRWNQWNWIERWNETTLEAKSRQLHLGRWAVGNCSGFTCKWSLPLEWALVDAVQCNNRHFPQCAFSNSIWTILSSVVVLQQQKFPPVKCVNVCVLSNSIWQRKFATSVLNAETIFVRCSPCQELKKVGSCAGIVCSVRRVSYRKLSAICNVFKP